MYKRVDDALITWGKSESPPSGRMDGWVWFCGTNPGCPTLGISSARKAKAAFLDTSDHYSVLS